MSDDSRLPGMSLVLRRIWWVLIGALLGFGVGFWVGLLRPAEYSSTAIVTVSSDQPTDEGSVARAAQALARLATQPSIVSEPLGGAGLDDVAADPRQFITVQAAPDAPIISVTGTARRPESARDIADTISSTLARPGVIPPFRGTVVAAPELPRTPTVPSWALPAGGVAVGAGLTLILAATVPRRRLRRAPPTTPVSVQELASRSA